MLGNCNWSIIYSKSHTFEIYILNDKLYKNLFDSRGCDINHTTEIRFNIILYLNNMFSMLLCSHLISHICILCIAYFVIYSLLNGYLQTNTTLSIHVVIHK